jgi:hypothetical protein
MQTRLPSGVGEHGDGRCRRVVDDGPAGGHGCSDPFVGHNPHGLSSTGHHKS